MVSIVNGFVGALCAPAGAEATTPKISANPAAQTQEIRENFLFKK
jgi:hypothetical protein